jgi:hypothetical protein
MPFAETAGPGAREAVAITTPPVIATEAVPRTPSSADPRG